MTDNKSSQTERWTQDRYQDLYQEIRERIFFCEFPPGAMLSENALIAELGAPRSQVRKALQRLEFEELVISRQGLGTVIMPLDLATIREVYALRIKLEELVGELLSTLYVPEEQVEGFHSFLERLEELRTRFAPREWVCVMLDYHKAFVNLLPDGLLRNLIDQLYYRSARIALQVVPQMSWAREMEFLSEEIAQVSDSLRGGDIFAASRVRRDQLSMWLRRLQNYLGEAVGKLEKPITTMERSKD